MRASDLFGIAGGNLTRRKGRTLLTLIGVVIGVGALVLMISLGIGLKRQILKSFQSEEILRSITVTKIEGARGKGHRFPGWGSMGAEMPISREEIRAMEELDGVSEAYPQLPLALPCEIPLVRELEGETKVQSNQLFFTGISDKERDWLESILVRGSLWKPGERGCVLAGELVERWFELKIDDIDLSRPLRVTWKPRKDDPEIPAELFQLPITGIVDSERLGITRGRILVPLDLALDLWDRTQGGVRYKAFYEKDKFPVVMVKTDRPADVDSVKSQLKNMGYETLATVDVIDMINKTFLVVEAFMGCIGAIGLLVSLFGIANTMTMSVLERTREIGIMKALGARNRDIRRLFLVEAAWIGLLGGVVGLLGGWGLGFVLNAIAGAVMELPAGAGLFHVTLWLALGSVVFATGVSVIAGVIPAVRASRLDPVVSLRFQ